MKFFVDYTTASWHEREEKVFDTIEQVLTFLNEHAAHDEFRFTVIEGRLVEIEPIERVKAYRVKR